MMMWGGFPFLMVHYLGWLYSDPCLLEMGPIYGLEKHNFGTCQMILGFGGDRFLAGERNNTQG